MRKSRPLALIGPAVALYVVADAASVVGRLDLAGFALAAAAVVLALAPAFVLPGGRGAARVAWLGTALGVSTASLALPPVPTLAVELAAALGPALAAVLVVDLALDVPDRPRALSAPWVRLLAPAAGAVVGGAAALAALPALEVAGGAWLAPSALAAWPAPTLAVAVAAALVLRLARPRLGSGPAELASSGLAAFGLAVALALGAAALALRVVDGAASPYARGAAALAAGAMMLGHARMLDPSAQSVAGRTVRRAVSAALALGAAAAAGVWLRGHVPSAAVPFAALLAALLLGVLALHRAVAPAVERLLAPAGGRLLSGVDAALAALGPAVTFEDVARAALPPLRPAGAQDGASPAIFLLDPATVARVDLAGEPHVEPRALPEALRDALVARPGEVVVRAAIEARIVRRPTERPLLEALAALDAAAVVPLATQGELDGALVLPRGGRRRALALEELRAVERLGAALAARVAILAQAARAERRARDAEAARAIEGDRVRELRAEVEALRADVRRLASRSPVERAAPAPVAYSASMRAALERLRSVAPVDAPVHLVGDGAPELETVGFFVHAASGRSRGPWVVADCLDVRPERAEAALFGDEGPEGAQPGWLRLAAGGTLLLFDVPALPRDVQRALADALAARVARAAGANGAYPVDARVLATSRRPAQELLSAGALDPELAAWLCASEVAVPALRERREDVPSLVLLALDRAARALGREAVGIDRAALDALLAHPLPGGVRELQALVDRAVLAARGPRVTFEDLGLAPSPGSTTRDTVASPPREGGAGLAATPASGAAATDLLAGTYEELERRILEHALARAGGNKSEAARLLALKRTTFLDKLRRYDLHVDRPSDTPPGPAQGPRAA